MKEQLLGVHLCVEWRRRNQANRKQRGEKKREQQRMNGGDNESEMRTGTRNVALLNWRSVCRGVILFCGFM